MISIIYPASQLDWQNPYLITSRARSDTYLEGARAIMLMKQALQRLSKTQDAGYIRILLQGPYFKNLQD